MPRHPPNMGHTHRFVEPTVRPFARSHESTPAWSRVFSVCRRLSCSALFHLCYWPKRDRVQCRGAPPSAHVSVTRHVPLVQSNCEWQTGAMDVLAGLEALWLNLLTLLVTITAIVIILIMIIIIIPIPIAIDITFWVNFIVVIMHVAIWLSNTHAVIPNDATAAGQLVRRAMCYYSQSDAVWCLWTR